MAAQPTSLAGKVAAITGGARGIGAATARAFVAEGMKVAIGDLDVDLAQKTADEIGGGTIALPLDVTDLESFERFVEATEEQLGPLDVLVNNAGIMPISPLVSEDHVAAKRLVDINIHGVLYGTKLALQRFLERDRGHLVNIASTAGKAGLPGLATYCGTKHFVVGMSEAARQEVRGTGVEVACIMPAIVNTELTSGVTQARGIKPAEPEEVAAAIVGTLKSPKFDVFVPRSVGAISKVINLLPRGGREGIARILKADKVATEVDAGARRAYEVRAAHSEPGLPPADEPKQLTPAE
jgi:NADP-dependent 3-hydroxy acid dehydrogenase YdfG